MKRIVVTGCQGFLGQRLICHFKEQAQVTGMSHADLDITQRDKVINTIRELKPDLVIHTAAISNTWYAQNHPEESEMINKQGSIHVAEACQAAGCRLIYMSSDQVYQAEKGLTPWREDRTVLPESVYACHKLEAEKQIQSILPDALGLRLSWMYDLPGCPWKLNSNLPANLLKAFQNQETIMASPHEFRGITDVWEVVRNMESCLDIPGGIYNFGCPNQENSLDTFRQFATIMELPHPEKWIQRKRTK